jgi:divalent metal cation (Fe/Co/Zn/Cd) transporter
MRTFVAGSLITPAWPLCDNLPVNQEAQFFDRQTLTRIQAVQTITIGWMALEAGASLLTAWTARSPALLAFGGDSVVELVSASVVFWRFTTRSAQERAERSASRIAGVSLFVLGAFVVFSSMKMLLDHSQPSPSFLGICVLLAAVTIMPLLAREKRRLSALACSAALRADAAQSNLCAYLALVALAGLTVNAFWQIRWADPIAALLVVPFVGYEGLEAIRGKHCGCG